MTTDSSVCGRRFDQRFMIHFSALGFLVYLKFRVFRDFLLFRPQKWEK